MTITLDGTTGIATPGLVNTGTEVIVGLTTTGNTILGDASTDTLNVGNGGLVKDASGNVGIGTSSPSKKLSVYSSSAGTSFVNIYDASGTSGANPTLQFGVYDSNGFSTSDAARVWTTAPSTATASLNFSAYNGGVPSTAQMVLTGGNVGIGTSSPAVKLEILGTSAANSLRLRSTSSSVEPTAYYDIGRDNDGYLKFNGAQTTFVGYKFFNTGTEAMRIDSSGRLFVGQTASIGNGGLVEFKTSAINTLNLTQLGGGWPLVCSNTGSSGLIYFTTTGAGSVGTITTDGSTTSYNTSSDQRLKENIIDAPSALNSVNSIKVRSFDWKASGEHQEYGYIAQELLEVAPEAVSVPTNEDEMMGVDFGKLTPRLVKAIQELKTIIDTQNDTINNLTTRLETLEGAS